MPFVVHSTYLMPKQTSHTAKMTCFDNCICYQNCNCVLHGLRDDAMLVLVTAIYGQCGQCSPCEVQQQLKFALSTKILATVKTDWPL